MDRRDTIFLGVALLLVLAASTSLRGAVQTRDPILGTWNLAVERSIYDPGPAPRSQRRIYEAHPDGVKATVVTVDATGQSSMVEYIADYDSMEYPLLGTPNADTIALVQLDPNRHDVTVTFAGRVIATARRVISPDGELMTVTVRSGAGTTNVTVFEREE